jgi:hypothetical protein
MFAGFAFAVIGPSASAGASVLSRVPTRLAALAVPWVGVRAALAILFSFFLDRCRAGEITHRISRNCAVLLGSDVESSRNINKDVKDLYGLRCAIVHAGKVKIEKDELKRLRDYVRKALRAMLDINKDRNTALGILDEVGFGKLKTYLTQTSLSQKN